MFKVTVIRHKWIGWSNSPKKPKDANILRFRLPVPKLILLSIFQKFFRKIDKTGSCKRQLWRNYFPITFREFRASLLISLSFHWEIWAQAWTSYFREPLKHKLDNWNKILGWPISPIPQGGDIEDIPPVLLGYIHQAYSDSGEKLPKRKDCNNMFALWLQDSSSVQRRHCGKMDRLVEDENFH